MQQFTTLDQVTEFINTNPRAVLCFTAPSWCGPCRQFKPVYNRVAEQQTDIAFATVDFDEATTELIEAFNVSSVPTVLYWTSDEPVTLRSRTVLGLTSEIEALTDTLG